PIGQAHHLQSFSQARAHIGLARAPSQFQTGGLIKMNFVHGVGNLHTYVREYYALWLSAEHDVVPMPIQSRATARSQQPSVPVCSSILWCSRSVWFLEDWNSCLCRS